MVWTLVRETSFRDFPGSSVVKSHTSTEGGEIQSLAGKLRSYKLRDMTKKRENNQAIKKCFQGKLSDLEDVQLVAKDFYYTYFPYTDIKSELVPLTKTEKYLASPSNHKEKHQITGFLFG